MTHNTIQLITNNKSLARNSSPTRQTVSDKHQIGPDSSRQADRIPFVCYKYKSYANKSSPRKSAYLEPYLVDRRSQRRSTSWMGLIFNLLVLLNLLVKQTIESEAFIKLNRFYVPSSVRLGDSVRLVCAYELSGLSLHAMKLFKEDKEFYRYSPSERPEDQKMDFEVAGVSVDLARSNEREVVLRNVNKRTAGLFKCEVSVEGTFKSISVEKRMEVQSGRPRPPVDQAGGLGRQQRERHTAVPQQSVHGGSSSSTGRSVHRVAANQEPFLCLWWALMIMSTAWILVGQRPPPSRVFRRRRRRTEPEISSA